MIQLPPQLFYGSDFTDGPEAENKLKLWRKGQWNESDHDRAADGKFGQGSSSSGGKGGALKLDKGKLPESPEAAHGQAQKVAQGWLSKLGGLPRKTVDLAVGKAQKLYDKMAAKYGRGWARAIVSVGIVTFPTPFTTGAVLAMIGLAKLSLKLSGKGAAEVRRLLVKLRKALGGEGEDQSDIDMETALARAGRFVEALAASLEGAAADLDAGALRQLERVAESLGGEDADGR